MNDIDLYRNSSIIMLEEVPSKIVSWIIILIFSALLFLSISIFFRYKRYLKYEAIIKNDNIEFYVDKQFFSRNDNKEVLIDNKKYHYEVIAFEEYSYSMGDVDYWKVTINVELPKELMIENNRILLEFLKEDTTLAKSIINKFKKGLE